ncbi:MAG: hypothetical protein ACRCZ1_07455 [Cetobacterium sp.]
MIQALMMLVVLYILLRFLFLEWYRDLDQDLIQKDLKIIKYFLKEKLNLLK